MKTGGRKDVRSPRLEEPASKGDGLLTSEDLFGDMVDAPPEAQARKAPSRGGPIRVQVSEPGAPRKDGHATPPAAGEVLPADVAALLDAFSEPAEAVARAASAPAATPPRAVTPPRVVAPPPPAPAPAHDALLEALLPSAELEPLEPAPAPPAARPTPPPKVPPPAPPEVALDDLIEPALLQAAEVPAPVSRIATKFQAAPPATSTPIEERVALDLAALAENALGGIASRAPGSGGRAGVGQSESLNAGQAFGPYRLIEKVAIGGMAEVFKAKRSGVEGFEKVVAMKRILTHLSDNKEFVDMFIDEAKMVAGLTHPNIVQIFDLGRLERSYYIAMEYIHGRDLRSIMKRAKERGIRLPMDLSVAIVTKVCAALEYAHRKKDEDGRAMRIVHRDVSPQNILISFEGDVKLTDFGIAKAATKASTTERGALRGKLLYMSPEQAWGKAMDRRSDIFSLGIVLYEMITDQRPFLASSEMSILEMVRECRVAPPTSLNPRVPEKLEQAMMKALERDPEMRYQDAGEMARDMERALPDRKVPTAAELAKLMEVLFEEKERGDTAFDEPTSGEHLGLEVELESSLSGQTLPRSQTEPALTKEPDMSIDKLLKRFGIK